MDFHSELVRLAYEPIEITIARYKKAFRPHRLQLAKTTIVIEDQLGPDGQPGVTIEWDSSNVDEDESLANYLTAKFVQETCAAGGTIVDLDGEELNHDTDTKLN